jgi:NAD(P)-dependent dehydrogenase (short-subunit alcohol dehydrogenase family)
LNLRGRIAVVTGASRGIGRHAAVALAAQGAPVALVARGADALAATEHAIRAAGGVAVAFPCDVSRPDAVETLRGQMLERLGPPAILVNGAGVFVPLGRIQDTDPAGWIDTLMLNTVAPYLIARAFVDGMIAAGWGRIVNVSSAASLDPPGGLNSAYATSKVALNHFTRHLAAELAGTGVTANVIHPGDVKTEMWADIRDQVALLGPEVEGYRNWVQWVDATGGDPPEKATALILRLMDEDAAGISGQFLWIEDGLRPPLPAW